MDDYKENVTGKIKLLFPTGYGFIVTDEPLDEKNRDIFFHISSLTDETIEWADLVVGQKVTIGMVSISGKGLQALEVEPLRLKPIKKTRSKS